MLPTGCGLGNVKTEPRALTEGCWKEGLHCTDGIEDEEDMCIIAMCITAWKNYMKALSGREIVKLFATMLDATGP